MTPSIYDYIKQEETNFETNEIQIGDNWYWSFRNHVQLILHLKNGVFYTGENNWLRAFKNIMEPILNLSYWTEDIEVKDVVFYIEEMTGRVMSFLLKKYHDEVYVREHDLDTMFDELTESDLDYGGVLVQKGVDRPEILPLNSIAFCDQTDILGGPVAFKHSFSPSKLRAMAKFGWGDEKNGATISLDDLCTLATYEKDAGTLSNKNNKVPGRTIEVYIVRGNMPEHYLDDNDEMDYQCNQLQIVAFYTDKDSKQQGVTLYRKEAGEDDIKFFTSKKVYQRALGRGVGETLLHPQIWTNFLTIHKTALLEAASKVPLQTDDASYSTRNKIQDMENLEITVVEEGKQIRQIPTAAPANIQLIEGSVDEWFQHAQFSGAAFDPILGKEATSGTTFRGQERSVAQGRGLHDRRRGQRAKFIEEIYRDWIIPDMVKEIVKGKKFLASLSTEELSWVADQIVTNELNKRIKDMILDGKMVTPDEQEAFRQALRADFFKRGNRQLVEIIKGEFEDVAIKMGINIAGKQKDLTGLNDKILSIFQFILGNPQGFQSAMQIPALAKSFNDILEYSGLSPMDVSTLSQAPMQLPQQAQAPTQAPQLMPAATSPQQ